MKRKYFAAWRPTHVYQKGYNGNILFYCVQDRLVYYTIYCIEAEKYGIETLALCLMYNHIHSIQQVGNRKVLSLFNGNVEKKYAYEFLTSGNLTGQVFLHPFGWAQKVGDKATRVCMAYLANNASEKQLYPDVLDYRWNFIAYAGSCHPYSTPLILRCASSRLRRAVSMVKWYRKNKRYLKHDVLNQLFDKLKKEEQEQLIDYIITTYQVVNHEKAIQYWGSYEKMVAAFRVTSGSEYEISEENEDDLPYREMLKEVQRRGYKATERRYLKETGARLKEWMAALERIAPRWQVTRFLRLTEKDK